MDPQETREEQGLAEAAAVGRTAAKLTNKEKRRRQQRKAAAEEAAAAAAEEAAAAAAEEAAAAAEEAAAAAAEEPAAAAAEEPAERQPAPRKRWLTTNKLAKTGLMIAHTMDWLLNVMAVDEPSSNHNNGPGSAVLCVEEKQRAVIQAVFNISNLDWSMFASKAILWENQPKYGTVTVDLLTEDEKQGMEALEAVEFYKRKRTDKLSKEGDDFGNISINNCSGDDLDEETTCIKMNIVVEKSNCVPLDPDAILRDTRERLTKMAKTLWNRDNRWTEVNVTGRPTRTLEGVSDFATKSGLKESLSVDDALAQAVKYLIADGVNDQGLINMEHTVWNTLGDEIRKAIKLDQKAASLKSRVASVVESWTSMGKLDDLERLRDIQMKILIDHMKKMLKFPRSAKNEAMYDSTKPLTVLTSVVKEWYAKTIANEENMTIEQRLALKPVSYEEMQMRMMHEFQIHDALKRQVERTEARIATYQRPWLNRNLRRLFLLTDHRLHAKYKVLTADNPKALFKQRFINRHDSEDLSYTEWWKQFRRAISSGDLKAARMVLESMVNNFMALFVRAGVLFLDVDSNGRAWSNAYNANAYGWLLWGHIAALGLAYVSVRGLKTYRKRSYIFFTFSQYVFSSIIEYAGLEYLDDHCISESVIPRAAANGTSMLWSAFALLAVAAYDSDPSFESGWLAQVKSIWRAAIDRVDLATDRITALKKMKSKTPTTFFSKMYKEIAAVRTVLPIIGGDPTTDLTWWAFNLIPAAGYGLCWGVNYVAEEERTARRQIQDAWDAAAAAEKEKQRKITHEAKEKKKQDKIDAEAAAKKKEDEEIERKRQEEEARKNAPTFEKAWGLIFQDKKPVDGAFMLGGLIQDKLLRPARNAVESSPHAQWVAKKIRTLSLERVAAQFVKDFYHNLVAHAKSPAEEGAYRLSAGLSGLMLLCVSPFFAKHAPVHVVETLVIAVASTVYVGKNNPVVSLSQVYILSFALKKVAEGFEDVQYTGMGRMLRVLPTIVDFSDERLRRSMFALSCGVFHALNGTPKHLRALHYLDPRHIAKMTVIEGGRRVTKRRSLVRTVGGAVLRRVLDPVGLARFVWENASWTAVGAAALHHAVRGKKAR